LAKQPFGGRLDWSRTERPESVLQAMHNNALKQSVQVFQIQLTTGMKDRIDVQDWDKLPTNVSSG
jgi:hypothetical protein